MNSLRNTTEILFEPPLIRYRIAGTLRAQQPLTALRRVIEVDAGEPVFGSDLRFDLLDFGTSLWVVPENVGSLETHFLWADHLRAVDGFFTACIFWPPRRWLDGGILGLGLGRRPAARILTDTRLPTDDISWSMHGPLDPAPPAVR